MTTTTKSVDAIFLYLSFVVGGGGGGGTEVEHIHLK